MLDPIMLCKLARNKQDDYLRASAQARLARLLTQGQHGSTIPRIHRVRLIWLALLVRTGLLARG